MSNPRILTKADELKPFLGGFFVPTMGALHEGHAALIRRAASLRDASGGGEVVVSIFVNPTQFAEGEDFGKYPRTFENDVTLSGTNGATVIFAPTPEEMYPPGVAVPTPPLPPAARQPRLEDAFRPTHFAGVCQVVARLFDIVRPRAAVFGEKDYQQFKVISQLVAQESPRWGDLAIVPHPTVREPDGLAMSSRNRYLRPEQREQALGLWRAICEASETDDAGLAERRMRSILDELGLETDYAVVRDAETLTTTGVHNRPRRALVAARLESVRLIDNGAV